MSYSLAGAVAAASVGTLGQLGQWTPMLRPLWIGVHLAAFGLGAWLLWRGVQPRWVSELALFERLRDLRRQVASELGVPAYVVFGVRTLRELAARKPTSLDAMLGIHGIGETKLQKFGRRFLAVIVDS